MKERFRQYLQDKGYKSRTTIPAYISSIEKVSMEESLSWEEIAKNIHRLVKNYDTSGPKASIGEYGHRTVINALKRFQEFVRDTQK